MRYLSSGTLLGVAFRTCTDDQHYYIRFEATHRANALLFAMGIESIQHIRPHEDSGSAWYQIECTVAVLDHLRATTDGIGEIVFNQPSFGQMYLFEDHNA